MFLSGPFYGSILEFCNGGSFGLEKATLVSYIPLQLLPYLEQSGPLPANQSGFRVHYSTETALLSLLFEIYSAVDWSEITLLALYEISAAYHEILM